MKDLFLLFIPLPFIFYVLYMVVIRKPQLSTVANAFLDNGEHLLIWIDGIEEKIMLHDIKSIEYSRAYPYDFEYGITSESITVKLDTKRHFGNAFSFITPDEGWRWMSPGSESPFTSELRKRVSMARAQQKQNLT